jgi:hypothetical protein
MMCRPSCFDIVTWVDFENDGRRMPVPDLILSWYSSAEVSGVVFSALSGCTSSGTGVDEDVLDVLAAATGT